MNPLGVVAALVLGFSASAAGSVPAIDVEIEQLQVDAVLGETVSLDVTILNVSDRPTGPLLGHLVVVDPAAEGSADAEDWTDTLTLALGGLESGESSEVVWDVTPISAGTFFVMIVVAPEDATLGPGISSSAVFAVAESADSLQAAVLPVAIVGPLAVGGILWSVSRTENRRVRRLLAEAGSDRPAHSV